MVSASAGLETAKAGNVELTYSVVPTDYARGDFEDGKNAGQVAGAAGAVGTSIDIPEVDLELKSEAIVAKTRKLKAVWTPELAQDLNAYHSIDAEAELTSMLSDYISLEIDLECGCPKICITSLEFDFCIISFFALLSRKVIP